MGMLLRRQKKYLEAAEKPASATVSETEQKAHNHLIDENPANWVAGQVHGH